MVRKLIFVLIVLFFLSTPSFASDETKTVRQIYQDNIESVGALTRFVIIGNGRGGGIPIPTGNATAFFVNEEEPKILTCYHVVSVPETIKLKHPLLGLVIELPVIGVKYIFTNKEGKSFSAFITRTNKSLDLAELIVPKITKWKAVELETEEVFPGDKVCAIGQPNGLANSITAGIVSGLERKLETISSATLIQTDCPINPGNSGGPLFNEKGHVVGIVNALRPNYQSIAFAIPINFYTRGTFFWRSEKSFIPEQ